MQFHLFLFACFLSLLSCQAQTQGDKESPASIPLKSNDQIPFADTLSPNWIVLKATVYGKSAFLLLDNGTIPQIQLILFKHYAAAKGIIDSTVSLGKEMERIEKLPAAISVQEFRDTLYTEIHPVINVPLHKMPDGILGKGFLTKYIVAVDYANRTIQFNDSSSYVVPEGYEAIAVKPIGPFYSFDADLFIQGKRFTETLNLDLGNGHNGFFFGLPFYKKNKGKLKVDTHKTREAYNMYAKGGRVADLLVDSVVINGAVIKNIPSAIQTAASASYDGLLVGNSVLSHLGKLIFDMGRNKIYVRKGG